MDSNQRSCQLVWICRTNTNLLFWMWLVFGISLAKLFSLWSKYMRCTQRIDQCIVLDIFSLSGKEEQKFQPSSWMSKQFGLYQGLIEWTTNEAFPDCMHFSDSETLTQSRQRIKTCLVHDMTTSNTQSRLCFAWFCLDNIGNWISSLSSLCTMPYIEVMQQLWSGNNLDRTVWTMSTGHGFAWWKYEPFAITENGKWNIYWGHACLWVLFGL